MKAFRTPAAHAGKGSLEKVHHKYRGVRQRRWGTWVAEIRDPNASKRQWLGTFATAVDAAMAYDRAAVAIHGPSARLNLPSASPTAAADGSVFGEHAVKPVAAAASVFGEHGMKPVGAPASLFGEHGVKPMVAGTATSVFDEYEVKPMVTASVFDEHEVKPMSAHGGSGDMGITWHCGASWAAQEEVFADYLDYPDIAWYFNMDPSTEMLAYYPDRKSEDYQIDGFDDDVLDSPLWALGD